MADLVQNPFDTTQQASGSGSSSGSSTGSGLIAGNMTGGNTYSTEAPAANTVAQYQAATRSVDPATQTVQGQVDSILSSDSPLMQRARTLATQQMAQRGLVNSSMAVGAAQAAMMDKALPIAQQDANTYSTVASDNMAATNQAGMLNTGEQNKFSLQTGAQQFTASQAALDRSQQTTLQTSQQNFQAAQAQLDRAQQLAMSDKSIEAQKQLQVAQQQFTAAQAELDRTQQTSLQSSQQSFQQNMQSMQQAFQSAQAGLDRQQQAYLQDDAQAFQAAMQKATLPATFASNISGALMQSVNTIAADPNLSGTPDGQAPEGSSPKSRAIQSAINYANSQIGWANTFYTTNMPLFPTQ